MTSTNLALGICLAQHDFDDFPDFNQVRSPVGVSSMLGSIIHDARVPFLLTSE